MTFGFHPREEDKLAVTEVLLLCAERKADTFKLFFFFSKINHSIGVRKIL